ncbi:MAG TPA: ABC transporter substrate-binding protein [Terriglobales bacterium]|nr:ABC transporter substrate-binding protein [Terriglobales bacterium]
MRTESGQQRPRHDLSRSKISAFIAQHSVLTLALSALLFALGSVAEAQQPTKMPRIGYVSGTYDPSNQGPYVEALRQGLRELGQIEGKTYAIEYRGAQGKVEPIPALVKELLQLKVDILVLPLIGAIRAAKQATKSIPIVMITQVDPVAAGLVDSLARPGGNITGITTLQRDLSGKRLELLAEVVPRLSRVGILRDPDESASVVGFQEYENAARALKIQLQSLKVRGSNPDLESAFKEAVKERVNAIVTITNNPLFRNSKKITELAIKNRLPSMYEGVTWVESGGLMSYSANDLEIFRHAATFVDKILKGTKPADLPVEQPKTFELIINLKTAKQIGVTIPPTVLARADRVIR